MVGAEDTQQGQVGRFACNVDLSLFLCVALQLLLLLLSLLMATPCSKLVAHSLAQTLAR